MPPCDNLQGFTNTSSIVTSVILRMPGMVRQFVRYSMICLVSAKVYNQEG